MRHYKKRMTAVLLSMLLLLSAFVMSPAASAAEGAFPSNALVIIGNKTVTKNMTLNDVELMFGEPKIVTDSLFGGKICTFYGDNYSDYLYIETNKNEQIVLFATVSDTFRMKDISGGQPYSSADIMSKMERYDENRQLVVCGAMARNGSVSAISNWEYEKAFLADIVTGNKSQIPHTVAMYNATTTLFGYHTPLVYDEKIYDYVMQLEENGNNPADYARKNGHDAFQKYTSYGACGTSTLNPMYFARTATNYNIYNNIVNVAAFSYYVNSSGSIVQFSGAVAPELFVNNEHPVALTADEKVKLQNACDRYNQSVSTWNGEYDYYEVEPSVNALPIEPGKIKTAKIDGAIGYINAIRAGAGLPDLIRSDELTEGAQAKAAYTRYLGYAGLSNGNPHYPAQADGISDEFYQKCMLGTSENLYWGNVLTGMMKALDDGFGDPVYCGHRRNLLDPNAKYIGLGSVEDQSAQKFTGGQSSNVDFVCWPSNGVTPTDALYNSNPRWTISANNSYTFNNDTYVTVKLLNNESKTWTITRNDGDAVFSSSFISFYNSDLELADGYVYQVTLHNVVQKSNQQVTDYTYRAVIANVYAGATEAEAPSLTVEDNEIHLEQGDSYKLYGVLSPRGASKYIVEWTSSNPAVAEVSPCGMVRAKGAGTAVITATCGENSVNCTVSVTGLLLGDVDRDGDVSIIDATFLQRYLAEMEVPMAVIPETADADGDGYISIRDVTTIQRYLVGIIDHLG